MPLNFPTRLSGSSLRISTGELSFETPTPLGAGCIRPARSFFHQVFVFLFFCAGTPFGPLEGRNPFFDLLCIFFFFDPDAFLWRRSGESRQPLSHVYGPLLPKVSKGGSLE